MATFYIQLENKLLQISGELTAENISKALGYVPVSPNVTNELSQRVDNITFDSLKDNPFLQDGSGELNIVDESGNIIAKIDANGIHSVDFIAGTHKLTDKIDSSALSGYAKESWVTAEITKAATEGKVDLTGYATEEYVNNIEFYNIKDNPIVNNGDGKLLFVDENGYIGLQLEEDGLYVKDVIADGHTLSQKADKSELPTKVSELENDSKFITIDEVPEVIVPTKVSELENDKGYITASDVPEVEIPSLDGYVKSEDLPNFDEFAKTEDIPEIPEIPSLDGYVTEQWVNNKNYATEFDLKTIDYSTINNIPTLEDESGEFNIADENGNIGMKVSSEAVYAKDFVASSGALNDALSRIAQLEETITDLLNRIQTLEEANS